MILVTGAAGKTGRAVIEALLNRGTAVRAWVGRPAQVAALQRLGVTDIVVGDMADTAVYRQAATGVRAIYHICPNMHPDEVALGRTAIAAAQAAGVAHFVYHSVLHPQTEKMPHHWQKLRVEEMLLESGLPFTILQPAAYMQNLLGSRDAILNQGSYPVPYPVETALSLVDLLDVAAAAAVVLAEPGHVGATYELAGPEVLAQTEVAAILSQALGRPVRAEQIAIADWQQQAAAAGLGSYQIEKLSQMFDYYGRFGFYGNSNVLRWLVARPLTPLAEFVMDEMAGD
jgi:NAD(P)H dehydrogenase (quinone)